MKFKTVYRLRRFRMFVSTKKIEKERMILFAFKLAENSYRLFRLRKKDVKSFSLFLSGFQKISYLINV